MIVDTLAQWLLSLPARVPVRPWIKRATLLKLKCFQTFFCFHYASRYSFASTYSFLNQIRVNYFVLKYHVVAREFEYHCTYRLLHNNGQDLAFCCVLSDLVSFNCRVGRMHLRGILYAQFLSLSMLGSSLNRLQSI